MTDRSDLLIPLSQLVFHGEDSAHAEAGHWDTVQIGAMLQHVIQRQAHSVIDHGQPMVVSVTFDVSDALSPGEEMLFQSRIDRKTRTLIFASGTVMQGDRYLLKATVVFRIS